MKNNKLKKNSLKVENIQQQVNIPITIWEFKNATYISQLNLSLLYSDSIQGKLAEINELAKSYKVTHLDFRPVFIEIEYEYVLNVFYNFSELNSQAQAIHFISDLRELLDIDIGMTSGDSSLAKYPENLEIIFDSIPKSAFNRLSN